MGCRISITQVEGIVDSSGRVISIRVQGASSECRRLEIRISCAERAVGGVLEDSRVVDSAPDGSFDVTIPSILSCARCRYPLTVTVSCLVEGDIIHPECLPATLTQPLWCADEDCPIVTASALVEEDCSDDRRRTVALHVRVIAPPSWLVETRLETGDGSIFPATTERDYMRSYSYDASRAGTFFPRVQVVQPSDCPDIELAPVNIPYCPPIVPIIPCPRIHTVVVAGTVVPTPHGCQIFWIADTIPPGASGTFQWSFDGGASEPPTTDRIQARTYTTSGSKRVDVLFTPARDDCPPSRGAGSTVVENCEAPSGGGETTGCIIARTAAVMAFAVGLALLALSICATERGLESVANAARIASLFWLAVGLIAFLLWLLLCAERPCKPILLTFGLALIGAGVALFHLSACCPIFSIAGIASVSGGVALMLTWRSECNITWCAFFLELALFNGFTLAVVLIMLALFFPTCAPVVIALTEDRQPGLLEIIGGVSAALVDLGFLSALAYAVTCHGGFGEVSRTTSPRLRDAEPPTTPGP